MKMPLLLLSALGVWAEQGPQCHNQKMQLFQWMDVVISFFLCNVFLITVRWELTTCLWRRARFRCCLMRLYSFLQKVWPVPLAIFFFFFFARHDVVMGKFFFTGFAHHLSHDQVICEVCLDYIFSRMSE